MMLIKNYSIYISVVLSLAGMVTGCAGMAKDITPSMVSGAMEGLSDPETQRMVVEGIDEDRVKTMSALMSAGFVDGLLDTLEDPSRRKRLEAIVNGLTTAAAGSAVDSMLAHAADEKVQAPMRLAMRAGVTDIINAIFETVGSKTGNSEQRAMVFGAAVHEIAKQATLGFQDALDDTRRDRASGTMAKEDGALMIAAKNASQTGDRILWTLGIGLAAVALGLAVTLVWAIRKNRLRQSELRERDDALLLLTEAIQSTATQPGAREFHTMLKTSMHDRPGGEHIRKVLGEHGHTLFEMDGPV